MGARRLGARVLWAATAPALAAALIAAANGQLAGAVTVVCPTVGAGGVVTPGPANSVDWAGCDLTGADLIGASLRAANLTGANLTSTDLSSANLGSAILESANLTDANLTAALLAFTHLKTANISGADFAGANLTDVISGGQITASSAPVLPAGWQLTDGYLVGPGALLISASLTGANLSSADLASADLESANLTGANLSQANLTKAIFDAANLADVVLGGADLTGASLDAVESGGISGQPVGLGSDWAVDSGFLVGPGASLSLANASGADFANVDLDGASLYGADLANANLAGANLTKIDGAGLNLENANLTNANLTNASIAYVAFGAGAPTVQGADLTGATMTGVTGAFLAGGAPAALPAGWSFVGGFLLGPFANLDIDAALNNADLTGVNLAFANVGLLLQHDNLTRAIFWGSNVSAGTFYQDTWSDTICPDGSNSNLYVAGCFSARLFEYPGLISPRSGSTLRRAARTFRVIFRLAAASAGSISPAQAASLAAGRGIKAVFSGPRVAARTVFCGWNGAAGYFSCLFRVPSSVRTGRKYSYALTIDENQGGGFVRPPVVGSAVNPEHIHFR